MIIINQIYNLQIKYYSAASQAAKKQSYFFCEQNNNILAASQPSPDNSKIMNVISGCILRRWTYPTTNKE